MDALHHFLLSYTRFVAALIRSSAKRYNYLEGSKSEIP